ncbi:MAG: carboxypeptidase-like regulatory domain-containing protein, partial [Bryobacterales bacterium]
MTLVLVLAAIVPLHAQFTTASLSGTVTDPTGAVVPGAATTVRNVTTGLELRNTTDGNGVYLFTRLPIGNYNLTVENPGFTTYLQSGITLAVNQMATQNVRLEVGQMAEQITVEANAEIVNTRTATAGQLVAEKQIVELPLEGRRPERLIYLAAGSVDLGRNSCRICGHGGVYPGEETAGVNGAGMGQVNYQLDATGHNDTYLNTSLPFPNPDSVQEFNLQSSNFTAEFGNAAG